MLYLFYEGMSPAGIFDFYTLSAPAASAIEGGMIGYFAQQVLATPGAELPLGDGFDEYGAGGAADVKTIIAPCTATNIAGDATLIAGTGKVRPVILDDGSVGYGTMFGKYSGHDSGSANFKYYHAWRDGVQIGPNTIAGSGKVTGWFTPGIYGTDVYELEDTLDHPEDADTVPGTVLYADKVSAKLTTDSDSNTNTALTAYYVGFLGDPSLVSTSFGTTGADTSNPIMLFLWK